MERNNIINLSDDCEENAQTICRLCSVKSNLIDLFAPKNANVTMRILILLATGIEIKDNDVVSKMVCQRCCEIAIKLHRYRTNAVANDKLLKEQSGLPYTPPITDQNELLRIASNIVNEQNGFPNPLDHFGFSLKKEAINGSKSTNGKFRGKAIPKHPSVQKLFKSYKNIILPVEIFTSDISPVISLDSSEVNDWYSERLTEIKSKLKGVTFKALPRIENKIPLVNGSSKSKEEETLNVPAPSSQVGSNEVSLKNKVVPSSSTAVPGRRVFRAASASSSSRSTPTTVRERRVFREAPSSTCSTSSPRLRSVSPCPTPSIRPAPSSPCRAPSPRPKPATLPKHTVFREAPSSSRPTSSPRPRSSSPRRTPTIVPEPRVFREPSSRLIPSPRPLSSSPRHRSSSPRPRSSSPHHTPTIVPEPRVFREPSSRLTPSPCPRSSSPRHRSSSPRPRSSSPHHTPTIVPEPRVFREPSSRLTPSPRPRSSSPRPRSSSPRHTPTIVPEPRVFRESSSRLTPSPRPGSSSPRPVLSPRTTPKTVPEHEASKTTPSPSRTVLAPEEMPLEVFPKNNAENSDSTKRTRKRPYSKIFFSGDDSSDGDIGGEDFSCDYEPEDDIPRKSPSIDNKIRTSSNPMKPPKQPSARKRTAPRDPYTKRRRVSSKRKSTNEREKSNRTSSDGLLKVAERKGKNTDLSEDSLLVPSGHREATNVSDFELPNTELLLPDLHTGKTHEVFMCSICNELHDSKQEVADHEKTHLTCKFCKKKLKNVALLNEHQNESCLINIVKNKLIIKLNKIDTVPSVVEKYPEAFKQSEEEEVHPDIEEVVLSMPSADSFENEETVNQNTQAVCISSDDEDVKFVEISNHKIVDNSTPPNKEPQTVDLTLENAPQPNPTPSQPRIVPKEKDMIRSLFKKHSYPSEKRDIETQTFSASDYNIKYTNTNLIVLENMFPELACYKIPIHLESQTKISARFKVNVKDSQPTGVLECWAFKKTIEIQKRTLVIANRPPNQKNGSIVFNLLNHSKLVSSLKFPDSVIFKKPLPPVLGRSIPNIPKTTVPSTLATTSGSSVNPPPPSNVIALNPKNTTTQPTFVQFIKPTSTIQYQTPMPPPLLFSMNKDQPSQSSQQNVLHINNNVTNVNKFYLVANNSQQIPTRISNINYEAPYLNNLCANLLLPPEQSVAIQEIEPENQNSTTDVVPYNDDEAVLRVKDVAELH